MNLTQIDWGKEKPGKLPKTKGDWRANQAPQQLTGTGYSSSLPDSQISSLAEKNIPSLPYSDQ
jgi:hypothetical protein